MPTTRTVLPPNILLSQSNIYASQGNLYVLDANSGTRQQSHSIQGMAHLTVVNDMLYLNVSRFPDCDIRALRRNDGSLLWSHKIEGRLTDAPVIVDEIVYASIIEGTVYALRTWDGTLLWRSSVDPELDFPSSPGPIAFTSPTVVNDLVYFAPAVNSPLKPFVYVLNAKDGILLWKAEIIGSISFPLVVVDGVIYISNHNGCSALDAYDGVSIWQHKKNSPIYSPCSSLVLVDEMLYMSFSEMRHDVSFSASKEMGYQRQAFLCARRTSDGSLVWQQQLGITTGANTPTSPVVIQDTIYVGTDDGFLSAYRAEDGTSLWRYKTGGMLLSSPVGKSDVVYVGANDGYVYALRASDGVLLWRTFVSVALTSVSSINIKIQER